MVVDLSYKIAQRYERIAQECVDKLEATESRVRDLVRTIQTSLTALDEIRLDCPGHMVDVEAFLGAAIRGAEKSLRRIADERSLCEENLRERQKELRCAGQHRSDVRPRQKPKALYVSPSQALASGLTEIGHLESCRKEL